MIDYHLLVEASSFLKGFFSECRIVKMKRKEEMYFVCGIKKKRSVSIFIRPW
ncbi:hypothetical protein SAMN05216565_102541 [Litchfieldia salsa]|uniref:Uncharacterized protein n=1 Tax=Litchfieldia salsa TaxID=930152 RepID=A0A1H0S508_9BACI|nr:hypothetical protein SAMN05216565_102541 [Litchfieldia salsa]